MIANQWPREDSHYLDTRDFQFCVLAESAPCQVPGCSSSRRPA